MDPHFITRGPDALNQQIQDLMQQKAKVRRGVPWAGMKRPPQDYPHTPAQEVGRSRVLAGRTYFDTGSGWRVVDKPVSRRKKRILARRTG